MDGLARRVARNTAAQAAGKAAVLAIGAASIAITTRYLGAAGYGRFALALALVQMLGVLADAGLNAVVVREISREPGRTAALVGNALAVRLVLGLGVVAVAALLALVAPYAPDVRRAVLIAGIPFLLGLATASIAAVFQARLQMGRAAVADVAGRLAALAALSVVVTADFGFLAVVASTAVGAAVALGVSVALVHGLAPVRPRADRALWRELVVAGLPVGVTLAVNEVYFRADTFILSLFRPFQEVGLYTFAYRVYELLALFPAIVMTSIFPLLSRFVVGRRDMAARVLETAADVFLAVGVPIAAAGLVLAPAIARTVAGDDFAGAAPALRLLLCAAVFAWVSGLFGYALIAGEHQTSVLRLSVGALVLNVALNLALVPSYGPTAAAAIALGCEILLAAGGWLLVRRHLALTPHLTLLWRAPAAAAVMAAGLWWQDDLSLGILVPAGAALYLAALAALGGVDRRALEALRA